MPYPCKSDQCKNRATTGTMAGAESVPHTHSVHSHDHVQPGDSYAQRNRKLFNEKAHDYDNFPGAREATVGPANAFLRAYPFDKEKTSVMEFACGTGLISAELAPFSKSILGVDISEGVVGVFNERFKDNENVKAIALELKGVEGELGEKFDVIVCSSSYHHMEDLAQVTKMLAFFLKPGGKLLVCDVSTGGFWNMNEPPLVHIVAHLHGITEPKIKEVFEGAGLVDYTYDPKCCSVPREGKQIDLFLAVGTRV